MRHIGTRRNRVKLKLCYVQTTGDILEIYIIIVKKKILPAAIFILYGFGGCDKKPSNEIDFEMLPLRDFFQVSMKK